MSTDSIVMIAPLQVVQQASRSMACLIPHLAVVRVHFTSIDYLSIAFQERTYTNLYGICLTAYLDGNGDSGGWWNGVPVTGSANSGLRGYDGAYANASSLWLLDPGTFTFCSQSL